MDDTFLSTAMYSGRAIDCRLLSLNLKFYSFCLEELVSMVSDITQWLNLIVSEGFVVRQYIERKHAFPDRVLTMFKNHMCSHNYASYSVEAMVVSPLIHNATTFQNYFRNIRNHYAIAGEPEISTMTSVDYPAFWDELFPCEENDSAIFKKKLLKLFREENKKMVGRYVLPDMQALLLAIPYENIPDSYYGSFFIDLSAFCLGSHLDMMAETFAEFAEYLSNTYGRLNAHVSLQPPSHNAYSGVFSGKDGHDGSHEETAYKANEWYETYYVQTVEWFNAISPLAQRHMENNAVNKKLDGVVIYEGAKGNLIVRSATPISAYDIPDALKMKEILYPALRPGMSVIPYRTLFYDDISIESKSVFPRHDWAIVPVFENEIYVVGRSVAFISKC